jgi:mannose-1-phosphate guanylyltransferase
MLHAMIMAGGGGTRFWPRSRDRRPKQFLTLAGERTLLQQALDRAGALLPPANTWVITGEKYREETARQLPELPAAHVVGEPCGRDTAPCVAVGAALIAREDPEAVILVTPADHVIEPVQEFGRAAQAAAHLAGEHPRALITFGIVPTFPSTGYGYIHRGAAVPGRQGVAVYRVNRFREKPPADEAERFVSSGEYFWNSGIFVWRAAAVLDELRRQQPEICAAAERIAAAWGTPKQQEVLRREYEGLAPKAGEKPKSIDKGVMEGAREVLVVQAPFRWDDVGSWLALERMQAQDADGNTVRATHAGLKTRNCIVVGEPGELIATAGVENLLIVRDGDATLVADRRDENAVKNLVELLKSKGMGKFL